MDAVKSGEVVVVRAVNCGAWGKSRFAYPLRRNLQRTSLCLSPMKYSVLHLMVRWDGFWLQHNNSAVRDRGEGLIIDNRDGAAPISPEDLIMNDCNG